MIPYVGIESGCHYSRVCGVTRISEEYTGTAADAVGRIGSDTAGLPLELDLMCSTIGTREVKRDHGFSIEHVVPISMGRPCLTEFGSPSPAEVQQTRSRSSTGLLSVIRDYPLHVYHAERSDCKILVAIPVFFY